MLLNNFKKFLAISTRTGMGFTTKTFANTNRSFSVTSNSQWNYAKNNMDYATSAAMGLVIGSGTTPPQLSDYKLENELTSGFTENTGSLTFSTGKIIVQMTITATSALTINEAGIRVVISAQSADSTRDECSILLTRSVLPEPKVFQSGDTKTFTIEIDFNTFIDNVNNLQ